jgi:AcrR family transcriptional regulator
VPKRVDHEERRRQIADALLRTAATRGLHATGMREVAAEAGVSLRLVQYYFGTKEELMLSAMQHLAAQFAERGMARIKRIKETENPVDPRDVIAAILAEGLPADDERRTFTVLYTAYFALSLTDPALAIAPLVRNSNAVIDVVAAQLRAAQAAGDTPAHLDPDTEAVSLLAMSAGLGTSILGGQSSAGQAQAVIDYHLHRLFPTSRPALRRLPMKYQPKPAVVSSRSPTGAGPWRRGSSSGLARLSSPATHTGARPDARLPNVTDLARRQPAPRAHQTSRLPQLQTSRRTRCRGLDAEMGTTISPEVMSETRSNKPAGPPGSDGPVRPRPRRLLRHAPPHRCPGRPVGPAGSSCAGAARLRQQVSTRRGFTPGAEGHG